MIFSDVLVIGSGVSGLTYAIKCAEKLPNKQITIITKKEKDECNTKYAQGGISIVLDNEKDSFDQHIKDTIIAGDGLCDEEVVRFVIEQGPDFFKELVEWGARFDKNDKGTYDLGREGGHTQYRVAHYKDITGYEIERALLERIKIFDNVTILEHHYAIDLITEHHISDSNLEDGVSCFGAYIQNRKNKEIETYIADITLLAMGGAGQVYAHTTNPKVATGDGIGLAYRAKARITGMQFYQFHPTALYSVSNPTFLISEAVRGFGAKLRTKNGKPFMHKYDEREGLASRDIVARAIDNEMKVRGDDYVCLDCRDLNHEEFMKHFPNIYEHCKSKGIDAFTELIPVIPAAHYMCGGIEIDAHGKTTLENLYAIGECTFSGLHGSNRLASNSLLEGLVFGNKVAKQTASILEKTNHKEMMSQIPEWNQEGMKLPEEMAVINYLTKELRNMMSNLMSIVRSQTRLDMASYKLKDIYNSVKQLYDISILTPQLAELRNLVSVAHLIIEQSKRQKENKGAFYNKDLK